jgi:hypothetical protein
MSEHENEPGHGNSTAAWSAVITAIVGVAVATLGVVLPEGALVVVGSVITVIALPLGIALSKIGYGVNGTASTKK